MKSTRPFPALKSATGFALLLIAAVCWIVSDGSGRVLEALRVMSKPTPTASGRALNGLYAEQILKEDWSQPLLWSADALEAMGWAKALQADGTRDPTRQKQLMREAADVSWRAVKASPVIPTAWVRLQILSEGGVDPAGCRQQSCVERSYAVAPMTMRPAMECERYVRAYQTGLPDPQRLRLYALTHSDIGRDGLIGCLAPLGPEITYDALRLARRP